MTDYKDGILHGLKLSINALFGALISGIGDRQLVANEIVWAASVNDLEPYILKSLKAEHFFHNIWENEPVEVLAYYSYEKKYIRGPANEVLSFDYTEEKTFLPLKQKLEELYGKATNNKYFRTDNKTVYVYTVKGYKGIEDREVAVMFKDGRTVFGSPWNIQDYY